VQEECNERGKDSTSCGRDSNRIEYEGCIECRIQGVETILDLRWPVDVREVDMERADFEFSVELLGNVEMVYSRN
jgi:hypothetical protein